MEEECHFVFSDKESTEEQEQDSVELLTEFLNPGKNKHPPVVEEPAPKLKKKARPKKKFMSKALKRLCEPTKPKGLPIEETIIKKRKPADPKTFDRLYEMSKQKEQKQAELQKQYEDEEIRESARFAKKSCTKSTELVANQYMRFLDSIFDGYTTMSEEQLVESLRLLGLLTNKQYLDSVPVVLEESQKWRNDADTFDIDPIRRSLTHILIDDDGLSPFQTFAKQQIAILLANGGKLAKKEEVPVEVHPIKHMHKDTLDRLTKLREHEVSKKPAAAKKRPTFVPKVYIDWHMPDAPTTDGTREILMNSELAQLPLEERQRILAERKEQKMKRMNDEEKMKEPKPSKPLKMPELSDAMKQQLEDRKERLKNKPPEGPSFKPKVTSYEDFLKVRDSMLTNKKRPEGWDKDITRKRLGYEQHLKKMEEEAQGIDLLKLRSSARRAPNQAIA